MTAGTGLSRALICALPLVFLNSVAAGIAPVLTVLGITRTAGCRSIDTMLFGLHGCFAKVVA